MVVSTSIAHDECIQDGIAAVTVDLQKPTYASYLHDDFDPWKKAGAPCLVYTLPKLSSQLTPKASNHLPGCITKRIHPFRVR